MTKKSILRAGLFGACAVALGACASSTPLSERVELYDLSHKIPMFKPKGKNLLQADLRRPYKDSRPIASFGFEGVRTLKKDFKTATGAFKWGYWVFDEHYSTHLDSTDHYQNNKASLYIKKPDNRSVDQYKVQELVGPIVYLDVSARVNAELAKNGGRPSPDRKKTSFDNMVTPADIEKLAPQIKNGVWIVVHTGWSKFFVGAPPKNPFMHPYINGLNYPGFGKAVVEKLIEIEDKKGVRIAGIVMDNLSVDSGRSGLGSKGNPFGDGWYVHQLGLQRGWKLVENATNLGSISGYKPGQCTMIVGA